MTTRGDLEAQLDRDPRDVHSFLVYADLLLEQGLPHGELIRLQHALTPDSPPGAHVRELELRTALLPALRDHGSTWELGFPRAVHLNWVVDWTFPTLEAALRGPLCRFIESMTLTDYVSEEKISTVLPHLPRLEEVVLRNSLELLEKVNVMRLLGSVARLERLKRLGLAARDPATQLFGLPRFPNLERLTLISTHVDEGIVDALRTCRSRLPAACELRLEHCGLPLAAEERLKAIWPVELEPLDRPGVVVVSPGRSRGAWLLDRPTRQLIGPHPSSDLVLDESYAVAFIDRSLRSLDRTVPLKEGTEVSLGDEAVVCFTENIAALREELRRSSVG